MRLNDVIALLLIGIGVGWTIGYIQACFVKERERAENERLRKAALEDARLDGLRSVR